MKPETKNKWDELFEYIEETKEWINNIGTSDTTFSNRGDSE